MPARSSLTPATSDEELLCCLGPDVPALAGTDPERVARIRDEVAAGFAALADVADAVSIFGSRLHEVISSSVRRRAARRR